jgi:hypothetical protein
MSDRCWRCCAIRQKEVLDFKKDVQEVLHHQIEVQELYQQIKVRMCCTIRQRCRSCMNR